MIKASVVLHPIDKKSFNDYSVFLTRKQRNNLSLLAKNIRGISVIHLSARGEGGGVAEMLKTIVPLENALGLKSNWYTVKAPNAFFAIAKKIHNSLQSAPGTLTSKEKKVYLGTSWMVARALRNIPRVDIYVIHDPQLAVVVAGFHERPMILRIHIDLSNPNKDTLSFFTPFFNQYDAIVFSMKEFVVPGISTKKIVAHPAIDPLTPKNKPMNIYLARQVLQDVGIHPGKPLISQISRFDPWKDPIGVIETYYRVKNHIPHLQLALVGITEAIDDPEARDVFERVEKYAKEDPSIFLFARASDLKGIPNDMFVSAIQTASDVVLQKSLKEGFGLTVSEAMWKGKAVVAGNVGGIKKQIRNGKDGFLVNNVQEAAARTLQILRDQKLKERLGKSAKTRVKNNFLITRHVYDHLKLYTSLLRK